MSDRLRNDDRTAWAMHSYQQIQDFPPIPDHVADHVLTWLQSEHAEVLTRGRRGHRPTTWPTTKRHGLVVRTLTRTLLLHDDLGGYQWASGMNDHLTSADNYRWGDLSGSLAYRVRRSVIQVFVPTVELHHCMAIGAGHHILRLPERPDVPAPPDLDAITTTGSMSPQRLRIPTGWESLEELAKDHLHAIGIRDAVRTGAGADGGIDITSADVDAQVKHTALPIGRPVLQQLIGAAATGRDAACYATAGYTGQALAYADDRSIALFQISEHGEVTTVNTAADTLERIHGPDAAVWEAAEEYAVAAIERASNAYFDLAQRPDLTERSDVDAGRASGYAARFHQMVREAPSVYDTPRSMMLYTHHMELLIATWATHTFGYYPTDAPPVSTEPVDWGAAFNRPGLSDFY